MGCSSSEAVLVKEHVVIDISYCGSCGWSPTAKQVCDAIKKELPYAVIDCRHQKQYTGVLIASLLLNKKDKKQVFRGNKEQVKDKLEQLTRDVVVAYKAA